MARKVFRIILFGGLGDALLSTPAFRALKKEYPDCRIVLFCFSNRQQTIFKNNPHIDRVTRISYLRNPVSFIRYYMKWGKFHDDFYAGLMPTLFCNKNSKELIADLLGVPLKDDKIEVFLSPEEEEKARNVMAQYKNPIAMHITSLTSKNQEWDLESWEALVEQMPEYTFIQLGTESEARVKNAVDLRGKVSFRDTLALIKYSRSFVGVNSSFSHATNAFDIPGVVLFGPSQPAIWGHDNNINIYKPLRCSPCLDLIFRAPCPYGKPCMKSITVEEVKTALLQQLQAQPADYALAGMA